MASLAYIDTPLDIDADCRLDHLPLAVHIDHGYNLPLGCPAPMRGYYVPAVSPMVTRAQSTARGTAWHAVLARTSDAVR